MHLVHLSLRNFRNYDEAHFAFSPMINLILGENGRGKTNLLEAIYLISTGRSFRTRRLSDLIRIGATFFYIEARFLKEGVEQTLKIYYDETARKVQYNATSYSTLTSLLGILPGVLLSPDDLCLISGAPEQRRRFLDLQIAQTDPLYVHHLARYFRAMKQRNHLLRLKQDSSLNAWEEAMAQSGSYLIHKRQAAIDALHQPVGEWLQKLSCGKDTLTVKYPLSSNATPDHLAQQWKKSREKEMHFGSTLHGPHRDDLDIYLSEKPAKNFSSEGQKRSITTALRLAEWQQLHAATQEPPLLGIDDFGLQLDPERRNILQMQMPHFGQVFLTSPHHLPTDTFAKNIQVICIPLK